MSGSTTIEWTQGLSGRIGATWNPVTGCSKVSPGCAHCYAETFAERFRGVNGHAYERGFDLQMRPERLGLPLRWRQPRLVFVNSMSDLFHDAVPISFIQSVFRIMSEADQHVFQILTKRHQRLADVAPCLPWPDNVWIGVSIENHRYLERAEVLRQIPAAVRFISAEPLLGSLAALNLHGIDWLIAGGESGQQARPMHPVWVRELRDLCNGANVPFFFKQWGAHVPDDHWNGGKSAREVLVDHRGFAHGAASDAGSRVELIRLRRVGKGAAGRTLDGRTWDRYPTARRSMRVR